LRPTPSSLGEAVLQPSSLVPVDHAYPTLARGPHVRQPSIFHHFDAGGGERIGLKMDLEQVATSVRFQCSSENSPHADMRPLMLTCVVTCRSSFSVQSRQSTPAESGDIDE